MSGLVYDSQSGRLQWHCNAFVHEENKDWLMDLLCFAAIFQLKDAEAMALVSGQLELEHDHSYHPESGPREQIYGNLKLLELTIIPEGQKPITSVSKQLGHHSINITVDTYHHWIPGTNKSEVDQLDNPNSLKTENAQ